MPILTVLIFWRSCAGSYSHCEFMQWTSMSTIHCFGAVLPNLWLLKSFYPFFCDVLWVLAVKRYDAYFLCILTGCVSLLTITNTSKQSFFDKSRKMLWTIGVKTNIWKVVQYIQQNNSINSPHRPKLCFLARFFSWPVLLPSFYWSFINSHSLISARLVLFSPDTTSYDAVSSGLCNPWASEEFLLNTPEKCLSANRPESKGYT